MYLTGAKVEAGGMITIDETEILSLEKRGGIIAGFLVKNSLQTKENWALPIGEIFAQAPEGHNTLLITEKKHYRIILLEVLRILGGFCDGRTHIFFICRSLGSTPGTGKESAFLPKSFSVRTEEISREEIVYGRCLTGQAGLGEKGIPWATARNIKIPLRVLRQILSA